MKITQKIQALLEVITVEEEKFTTKGVAVAGTRLRKALQDLTVVAKEGRKQVTEAKNAKKA